MIKFENTEVVGWEAAIRGMRNPMNSWNKSDSRRGYAENDNKFIIGPNDLKLMLKLAKGGPVHAKYRRMIVAFVDITAPLYWWKEFDTYKVGTVANSCSTMHKIHAKEFTLDDFSHEHLVSGLPGKDAGGIAIALPGSYEALESTITVLNRLRDIYLNGFDSSEGWIQHIPPKSKDIWWQMIQLLPTSYNQKRTVMISYEVLNNIYFSRDNHKLDEWRIDFINWIRSLPYSEIITTKRENTEPIDKAIDRIIKGFKTFDVTACELCNAYSCGDSNEKECMRCQFYKYSKWRKPMPIESFDIDDPKNICGPQAIIQNSAAMRMADRIRGGMQDIGASIQKGLNDGAQSTGSVIIDPHTEFNMNKVMDDIAKAVRDSLNNKLNGGI